jgi:hypothetical protein
MSVSLILNSLNEFNTILSCEPLASKMLFYSKPSINVVMNLHELNILCTTYKK